jgi:hypothetical protein
MSDTIILTTLLCAARLLELPCIVGLAKTPSAAIGSVSWRMRRKKLCFQEVDPGKMLAINAVPPPFDCRAYTGSGAVQDPGGISPQYANRSTQLFSKSSPISELLRSGDRVSWGDVNFARAKPKMGLH